MRGVADHANLASVLPSAVASCGAAPSVRPSRHGPRSDGPPIRPWVVRSRVGCRTVVRHSGAVGYRGVGRTVSDTRERVHYRILEAMSLRVQGMMQRSGFTPSYAQAECAVSDSLLALARTVRCGDTVELPDGTTLTCTFKP